MAKRSPIFGRDSTQIGYVEGGEAFDLSGRKRCNYSQQTGNLFDDRRKTVGHVSLAGKFVGVFSIADKLFPKFDAAELCGIGRTPSQPVSDASPGAPCADLAARGHLTRPKPSGLRTRTSNLQPIGRAATSAGRVATRYPKRANWERLQRQPSNRGRLIRPRLLQLEDEKERRAADAERRGIGGKPSQPISEARQVAAPQNWPRP